MARSKESYDRGIRERDANYHLQAWCQATASVLPTVPKLWSHGMDDTVVEGWRPSTAYRKLLTVLGPALREPRKATWEEVEKCYAAAIDAMWAFSYSYGPLGEAAGQANQTLAAEYGTLSGEQSELEAVFPEREPYEYMKFLAKTLDPVVAACLLGLVRDEEPEERYHQQIGIARARGLLEQPMNLRRPPRFGFDDWPMWQRIRRARRWLPQFTIGGQQPFPDLYWGCVRRTGERYRQQQECELWARQLLGTTQATSGREMSSWISSLHSALGSYYRWEAELQAKDRTVTWLLCEAEAGLGALDELARSRYGDEGFVYPGKPAGNGGVKIAYAACRMVDEALAYGRLIEDLPAAG